MQSPHATKRLLRYARLISFVALGLLGSAAACGGSDGGRASGGAGSPDAGAGALAAGGADAGGAESNVGAGAGDGGAGAGAPGAAYAEIFAADRLLELELTLSPQAIEALSADPITYQRGTLTYQGRVWQDVGIRLKGRASAQGFDEKPAFKLKFNEFSPNQRFFGLKRLTLNNMVQDPTMLRERLGYEYLRELGLPAPKANYARVVVNGDYYGLYLNLQTLDEVFVQEAFPGQGVGNLFDITNDAYFIDFDRSNEPPLQETMFVLETNEARADISDLTALIDAVWGSSGKNFLTAAEAVLDLDEVLALGAAQAVLADWDGYFGARNNYKAYHELERDKFVILAWGIDQTFRYDKVDYAIDHSDSERPRSLVYERCAEAPACLLRYRASVKRAVDVFEGLPLEAALDAWLELAADAAAEDPRQPFSAEEREKAVSELRAFIAERPARVRAQLP